ncbi:Tyrosine-protein kinase isoform SRK4, partial [Termitomyces sp. T112]
RVCIKAMRVFETMDKELVFKQFWKEVILWEQLCHPNIIPVYGLYRFQDRPCIVAPWMENGNITKYLKRNPEIPRLPLAVGVARGLYYLHDKGIIHGDLKGSNILVDDEGIARVADFGISSISDPQILSLTSHSGAASRGGTIRWQAPELFDMQNDTVVKNSKASDVYAWACVCYEIFTGSIPLNHLLHDATIIFQVKMGARPSRPLSSSESWSSWGLTEDIWLIMEDCWKAEPSDRPTIGSILNRLCSNEMYSVVEVRNPPTRFRAEALSSSQVISMKVLDNLISKNNLIAGLGSKEEQRDDHRLTTHQNAGHNHDHNLENYDQPNLHTLRPDRETTSLAPTLKSFSTEGLGKPTLDLPQLEEWEDPMERTIKKPYDAENLAKRPRNWRPDYRKTLIPRIPWPRSDDEEFRDPVDPIQRVINPILDYNRQDPHVIYELCSYPEPPTLSFPILGRIYNHTDFTQLATNPPVDQMRLFHPLLPWYIDVHKIIQEGVTVQDVIMDVYMGLQTQINARDYFTEELGSWTRKKIATAYVRRTQGNNQEKGNGIRKVDYLEEKNVFVGLVRTKNGMWEMKTRSVLR